MRYLYKQLSTTYEELLASAKEAEAEWLEHKMVRSKVMTASPVDPGKKGREELKSRIDKLTAKLKTRGKRTTMEEEKNSN